MRIQLWSYNYDPEPTGIGPVSRTWARAMRERGHEIHVIAAHPHYPRPEWGSRRWPYQELRDGIKVTRLPLRIGRDTVKERMRQEASFAAWQTAYLPMLGGADAVVAVSPCFPALAPAILNRKLRRRPLILWIQDILPDGAVSTGIMDEGTAIRMARRLESSAYRTADRIVVISESFRANLLAKGVPDKKLARIYNPATLTIASQPRQLTDGPPRVVAIGNIGHSQGLSDVVRQFEASDALAALKAKLIITGSGVAAEEVRSTIRTGRVEMLGVVDERRLIEELTRARVGLVSQRDDIAEFNLPSKLMNYLARGLPVIAKVGSDSEVARLVSESRAGLVAGGDDGASFADLLAQMLIETEALRTMSDNALEFATANLGPDGMAQQFDTLLEGIQRLVSTK